MTRTTQLAARFRRHAERLWDSTCVAERVTTTYDDETFGETETRTEVYTGACKARPQSLQEREVLFGDRAVSVTSYEVELPPDVDVRDGDVITFTASPDPLLPGREVTVRQVPLDEWVVVRKVIVELSEEDT